ncbi:MAG: gamma-glutamylcyclotransferase [Halocynthiibacter sp.]
MSKDFWVFGYGSLLWNPGFEYVDQKVATLQGYHRSFCMRSIHHRGTEDAPGLVLALDEDENANCAGIAFRVAGAQADDVMAYLRERELVSAAYLEKTLDIILHTGEIVPAISYVIDADHGQYCGGLPLEEQAQILATAVGGRGPNWEYLNNTALHLKELALEDADLNWLMMRVAELRKQTR